MLNGLKNDLRLVRKGLELENLLIKEFFDE